MPDQLLLKSTVPRPRPVWRASYLLRRTLGTLKNELNRQSWKSVSLILNPKSMMPSNPDWDELRSDMQSVKRSVDEGTKCTSYAAGDAQKMAKGLDRSLAALSLLAANQFRGMPESCVGDSRLGREGSTYRNPKNWIKNATTQKYHVVFICAHSRRTRPRHRLRSQMPKGWIAKIAPWLKLLPPGSERHCQFSRPSIPYP
jgi:hypothetical protein